MRSLALFLCGVGLVLLILSSGCTPSTPVPTATPTRTRVSTPTPLPTAEPPSPTPTPAASLWCDVWLNLDGPAGSPASRNPSVGFEAQVQGAEAAQVLITSPSGKVFRVPPYSDLPYGRGQRFGGDGGAGLPETGGPYTCTALAADGSPIPGAQTSDTYLAGLEPDPPANLRAEVVANGLRVTWTASPVIPGAFDPAGSPSIGYYMVFLSTAQGELQYGWNGGDPTSAHLIPLHSQDFGPADAGLALDALADGVYRLEVMARSVAPAGTDAQRDECISKDSAQTQQIVIENGQLRVQALPR